MQRGREALTAHVQSETGRTSGQSHHRQHHRLVRCHLRVRGSHGLHRLRDGTAEDEREVPVRGHPRAGGSPAVDDDARRQPDLPVPVGPGVLRGTDWPEPCRSDLLQPEDEEGRTPLAEPDRFDVEGRDLRADGRPAGWFRGSGRRGVGEGGRGRYGSPRGDASAPTGSFPDATASGGESGYLQSTQGFRYHRQRLGFDQLAQQPADESWIAAPHARTAARPRGSSRDLGDGVIDSGPKND